jgi:hypothetical protein
MKAARIPKGDSIRTLFLASANQLTARLTTQRIMPVKLRRINQIHNGNQSAGFMLFRLLEEASWLAAN